ncbi:MAG: hypothetical protein Q8J92_08395 [Parvibaculum sp.]|nr:hypothetical protein [Parvibaculum sp.]
MMQALLWTGTVINLVIFLPALWLLGGALAASGMAGGLQWLTIAPVLALPVLCIVAPALAWNQFDRSRAGWAASIMLAPVALAGVLASFMALV